MNGSVFRAYDIRGIYPEDLNESLAFGVGVAVVQFLNAKTLVVGEDARVSSPALRQQILDSVARSGCKVYYIGRCTTPLFYFSVNKLQADGGIMVTASHNPPQYGGIKIVGKESSPIGGETGLKKIEEISADKFEAVENTGEVEEISLVLEYIEFLTQNSDVDLEKVSNLKLVIDAGNGMTPIVLKSLLEKLNINYVPLYFDIDGNFPGHSPDISTEESLASLKNKVVEVKADLGVAFDGDGDRVMFVDENGSMIRADYMAALIYESSTTKPKVIYDVRTSRFPRELFGANGFKSKAGRTYIQVEMRKNDADLGVEYTGHFAFKEMNYTESAVLMMLKVLKIVSESDSPVSTLVRPFSKYYQSKEVGIPLVNNDQWPVVKDKIKEKYKDGKVDELDGVGVEYWDPSTSLGTNWWFNLRPSNTEPVLKFVVEASTKALMEEKVRELTDLIKMSLGSR